MLEDEHDLTLNNNNELFKLFPFFEAFPFEFYEFEFESDGVLNENSLLDPIIIKAGGGFVEPHLINFTYSNDSVYTTLSFYSYDIKYVHESADKIKKMDDLAKSLDDAIKSSDHLLKIKTIKQGERNLLKKIGSSLVKSGGYFDKILDQMKELNEIELTKTEVSAIKSLSLKKIEQLNLPRETVDVVNDYLDMHLHHINIILGIIIATKIY
jgi:hypothetical protein